MKNKILVILAVITFFGFSKIGLSGAYYSDEVTVKGITVTTGTWDEPTPTPGLTPHFSISSSADDSTTDEVATPEPTDTPEETATPEATPTPTDSPVASPDLTPSPDTTPNE